MERNVLIFYNSFQQTSLQSFGRNTKLKYPTAISSRASIKFVREELVKILKGSNMFLEVLEGHVQSYAEAHGWLLHNDQNQTSQLYLVLTMNLLGQKKEQ
jgi:hypothetical protein